jgi:hypothetical protein
MVKRLISLLLVLLVPMQAMASLSMDLQMQQSPSIVLESAHADAPVSHACHQEVSAAGALESDGTAIDNQRNCNACPLCMAFGLTGDAILLITADHLTQSVTHFTQTLVSADLSGFIKPPIL